MGKPNLGDYVEVKDRLMAFFSRFPEGSVQCDPPKDVTIPPEKEGGPARHFVEVTARVFRTPDDIRPGVASAREPFPGKTNFTRDSEAMNAETSAIGRALVGLGLATDGRIASREEVRNRVAEDLPPVAGELLAEIEGAYKAAASKAKNSDRLGSEVMMWMTAQGWGLDTSLSVGRVVESLTEPQGKALLAHLKGLA